jgi:hypothetical protein
MLQNPSHFSFRLDLHELWSKEGAGVKLGIWFLTTNPLKARVKWGPIGSCYTPLNFFFKGYKDVALTLSKQTWFEKDTSVQSCVNKSPSFGTPTWERQGKVTFGCSPHGKAQSILWGGESCLLPKVAARVKLMLEVVFIKSATPFPLDLHQLPFFLGCVSWYHLELSLVSSS